MTTDRPEPDTGELPVEQPKPPATCGSCGIAIPPGGDYCSAVYADLCRKRVAELPLHTADAWLARSLESIAAETADWPQWKRDAASKDEHLALGGVATNGIGPAPNWTVEQLRELEAAANEWQKTHAPHTVGRLVPRVERVPCERGAHAFRLETRLCRKCGVAEETDDGGPRPVLDRCDQCAQLGHRAGDPACCWSLATSTPEAGADALPAPLVPIGIREFQLYAAGQAAGAEARCEACYAGGVGDGEMKARRDLQAKHAATIERVATAFAEDAHKREGHVQAAQTRIANLEAALGALVATVDAHPYRGWDELRAAADAAKGLLP